MKHHILTRILWSIVGIILIAVGVICLCLPEVTAPTLALIFGFTFLVSGMPNRWSASLRVRQNSEPMTRTFSNTNTASENTLRGFIHCSSKYFP